LDASLAPGTKLELAREVLAAYVRVRWLMRRSDLVSTLDQLRVWARAHSREAETTSVRLGNAVGRTMRLLPTDSRCLMRSLVLSSLLARRHVDATLVIGVKPGPSFAAHAWVEQDGRPLLPGGADDFQRLVEL
jgi:hypothetical protein